MHFKEIVLYDKGWRHGNVPVTKRQTFKPEEPFVVLIKILEKF